MFFFIYSLCQIIQHFPVTYSFRQQIVVPGKTLLVLTVFSEDLRSLHVHKDRNVCLCLCVHVCSSVKIGLM